MNQHEIKFYHFSFYSPPTIEKFLDPHQQYQTLRIMLWNLIIRRPRLTSHGRWAVRVHHLLEHSASVYLVISGFLDNILIFFYVIYVLEYRYKLKLLNDIPLLAIRHKLFPVNQSKDIKTKNWLEPIKSTVLFFQKNCFINFRIKLS